MTESGGGCCRCCCSFIITLGLTALFMWLSLRTSNPKCSIHDFYLSALDNKSLNDNKTLIHFQLKLENPNKEKGIYYDDLNVTISDSPNRSHVIGSSLIPRFRQGHKKTARKNGTSAIAAGGKVALRAVSANRSAVFRVDLVTAVRFRIIWFKTKRNRIVVGADVQVNGNGTKVNSKDIRLSSSASMKNVSYFFVVVGFLFCLIFWS